MMDINEILHRCDHTLLSREASEAEIAKLCDEAIKFSCASVCIPPCHVAFAKSYVDGKMKICTVIGFPNGYNCPEVKAFEAAKAVSDGADEIDMVINIGLLRAGRDEAVCEEIRAVKAGCDGRLLKVIVEACLLTEEEKTRVCDIVSRSGAEYIKTSTGFSTGGATREDVALMRRCSPPAIQANAPGGISPLQDATAFVALGPARLGTPRLL